MIAKMHIQLIRQKNSPVLISKFLLLTCLFLFFLSYKAGIFNANKIDLLLQRGDRLYTSESDVCRRQILTYKIGPQAVRVKILVVKSGKE